MKNKKEMYKKAALRKDWVDYLRKNKLPTGTWTKQAMDELFTWAKTTTYSHNDLELIVLNRAETH